MKKLFFTAIACIAFSGFAMANNENLGDSLQNSKQSFTSETVELVYVKTLDYPFTVCYEIRRVVTMDPNGSGAGTVTVTYRCVTIDV